MKVQALQFAFDPASVFFENIDFQIEPGRVSFLTGPNGCGKSTLVKILAGIILPNSGEIFWGSRDLREIPMRERPMIAGFLPAELPSPDNLSVTAVVNMHARLLPAEQRRQYKMRVFRKLENLSREQSARSLSSGEKVRLYLALAAGCEPQFLLLDEPDAHLDIHHKIYFYREVREEAQKKNQGILAITHDLNLISHFADTVFLMSSQHKIVYSGPPDEAFAQEIQKCYPRALCSVKNKNKTYYLPL